MKKYVKNINGTDHVFRMTDADAKAQGAKPYEAPKPTAKRGRKTASKKAATTPQNKAVTPDTKDAADTEAGDGSDSTA